MPDKRYTMAVRLLKNIAKRYPDITFRKWLKEHKLKYQLDSVYSVEHSGKTAIWYDRPWNKA